MQVFTYSEARQNLSKLLSIAQMEEVEIRKRDGSAFSLKLKQDTTASPFDVPGIDTDATTKLTRLKYAPRHHAPKSPRPDSPVRSRRGRAENRQQTSRLTPKRSAHQP